MYHKEMFLKRKQHFYFELSNIYMYIFVVISIYIYECIMLD